jgi:hypothetical protein
MKINKIYLFALVLVGVFLTGCGKPVNTDRLAFKIRESIFNLKRKYHLPVTPEDLKGLAKGHRYVSLQKATYKPAKEKLINKAKEKKAKELATQKAYSEVKAQIARDIKKLIENLMAEAELNDKKLAESLYNKYLSEVFKAVDKKALKYTVVQKGAVYVLVIGDPAVDMKLIKKDATKIIAKAVSGERVDLAYQKVEIPKLEINTEKGSDIKVTSEDVATGGTKKSCVVPNPDYYFFGVFISDYKYLPDLPFVENDIKLVKQLATCYMGVPEGHIKILKNPSADEFLGELLAFIEKIRKPGSVIYFYYSGHGVVDSFGKFYFVPKTGRIDNEELIRLTTVSWEKVKEILQRAKKVKKVALIDACRTVTSNKGRAVAGFGVFDPNMAVIFSTVQGKVSTADMEGKHSAFTRALYKLAREGLANLDINGDTVVEIKEIEAPLKKWVKEFSKTEDQTPEVKGNKDLPLFPVQD